MYLYVFFLSVSLSLCSLGKVWTLLHQNNDAERSKSLKVKKTTLNPACVEPGVEVRLDFCKEKMLS